MMSGLLGTVAQGFAFGTGSAVAHRAVGAVANSFSGSGEQAPAAGMEQQPQFQQQAPIQQVSQNACSVDQQNFMQCLTENNGNAQACQFFFDSLQQCQQNQQFA
mmetsp:Transcript_19654/g.59521  ORF Transcript_19654/g.59521 Transcript_19654/m.59521 type:complete len:104 (+) Transcript_19654:145-456(+)|eukprot:CAMPEP_0118850458 /NCGR_PEP_ID=MMETSP1163-20130328/295_1 /TAXON_ID=124430 /ORGANISM="Phaeomonas parva, Strain CCMP2877" /LENGTH=103 /DNA_ID=CAMNT_0006782669 /DNA_START=137 /DNA_END=448 /DNA_ORIENTATION=-